MQEPADDPPARIPAARTRPRTEWLWHYVSAAIVYRRRASLGARLAAAALAVILVFGARLALFGVADPRLVYIANYPVVAAGWMLGGWPAAVLTTVLCGAVDHFWLASAAGAQSWHSLTVFFVTSLMVTGLAEAHERALRRLNAARTESMLERAARAGEHRLRQLVEATRDYAIIMLDPQGRITSWNEGARRITGYEADEVIGRSVSLFYTPEEIRANKPEHDLMAARRDGRFEEEGERVRKDGTRFWASSVLTPLLDGNGDLDGYLRINRDITDRRQARRQAAEALKRLESVLSSAMDAIITIDRHQNVLLFNPAAEKMFGHTAADVVGRPLDMLLPARHRNSHRRHVALFAETNTSSRSMARLGEISGLKASGAEFPIEASISQSEADGRKLLTVILRDVTERRRVEAALTSSDERMRLALQASNAGVWAWEAVNDVITVDGAYRLLYGFQADEKLDSAAWEARLHPGDRASLRAQVEWCAANDGQWTEEFRILHPVLGERWMAGRAKVLYDAQGEISGMTGITFDVTERKQADEHVRFIMRELSHRTKNLLAVVQAMALQSSQGAEDIEAFLERFTNRIEALRRSHDLLVKREWEGVALLDLVRGQLSPFLDNAARRLTVAGPHLLVKPNGAEDLGLVMHELATNASKYGALSVEGGRIAVSWQVVAPPHGKASLRMNWHEIGGPPASRPEKTGFGTTVIRDMLAMTHKARIRIDYNPEGLHWQMEVEAGRLLDDLPCASRSDVDTGVPIVGRDNR